MNYEQIKQDVLELNGKFHHLNVEVTESVPYDVGSAFATIKQGLEVLVNWVYTFPGTEEPENPELALMAEFLGKLRQLFEEYSASIEYADGEGYGENWGGRKAAIITVSKGDIINTSHTITMRDNVLIAEDFVIDEEGDV